MPHHLCRQGSLKIIEDAPSPGGEWGLLAAWCRTWLIYSLRARTWWVSVNNHIRIWQRNGSSINACLSMGTSDRRSLNQRWFILPWKPTAHTWVSLSVLSDSLWPRGLHAAWQAPPSVGFPRQEQWSRLPFSQRVRRDEATKPFTFIFLPLWPCSSVLTTSSSFLFTSISGPILQSSQTSLFIDLYII